MIEAAYKDAYARKEAEGALSETTRVWASVAVALLINVKLSSKLEAFDPARSSAALTSAAVRGVPSANVIPSRICRTHVFPSGLVRQESAASGSMLTPSLPTRTS